MDRMHRIEEKILMVRGEKVMIDVDLSAIYRVSTRALKQAVRRNRDRFPADFMFELTWEESREALRSQSVTLKRGEHRKYRPYAFTELGVAMLSTVLRSDRAIRVNIEVMRTFVRLRRLLATHADLVRKIAVLEKRYDAQFKVVFDAIRELMEGSKDRIGFRQR